MRVLLVAPYKTADGTGRIAGGMQIWTNQFMCSSIAKENEVVIVNTVLCGKRSLGYTARSLSDEIRRTKRIICELKAALSTESFDIAHVTTSCGFFGVFRDLLIAKMIRRMRIPTVVHYHVNIPSAINSFLQRKALKRLSSIAQLNIVLNQNSQKYLKSLGASWTICLPNGIECNTGATHCISDQIKTVLYVGQFRPEKGSLELVAIAKKNPDYCFQVVGDVFRDTQECECPENLCLMGAVDHAKVLDIMRAADVFIFPSHSEGFPIAVLEAMSVGLPIIATPVGAIPDMLENSGGILVDVGDIEGFSAALSKLTQLEARRLMSVWNIQKVHDFYDNKAVMASLQKLYCKILEHMIDAGEILR